MSTEANNIIEGNKLIENFMKPDEATIPMPDKYWLTYCQYNALWDQLMPVVEKIESLDGPYAVTIDKYSCRIDYVKLFNNRTICIIGYDEMQKIEGVWQAVVEFIKCHNQKQQKEQL